MPNCAEQPDPADAEQEFLHDAGRAVAAVNAPGQVAVELLILRPVAVEQVDGTTADVDAPGLEVDAGQVDLHAADHRIPDVVQHRFERQCLGIEEGVVLGLPIVLVDRLLKVALAVEEADADESKPQIACGTGVVSSQDSQASGRDREGFVEADLGREVGDRVGQQLRCVFPCPGVCPTCRCRRPGVASRTRAAKPGSCSRTRSS